MTILSRMALPLFLAITATTAMADCASDCDQVYEECKAATSSPNGEKVCGSDYHECKARCAESAE